ncbi:MAG: methyltransferase domain-containing protein [Acidobacteriota bacterium]
MKDEAGNYQACDLCGDRNAQRVLLSARLDGPLVRCPTCLLYFVATTQHAENGGNQSTGRPMGDAVLEMEWLAQRALELELVDPNVEEGERPWRELAARERIEDLSRFISAGRLLELGSSTGELLAVASERFETTGVEADLSSSRIARERGLHCLNGTLADVHLNEDWFDVAVLYHTIEHLPSPQATMLELHRVIRPGGWLVLETPNIATLWFRLFGSRWRQLIPDHRYFFTPATLGRLCYQSGFEIRELRSVGKAMSYRLFASRVSRYHRTLGRMLSKIGRSADIEDRTLRLRLGDVMRLYAVRR